VIAKPRGRLIPLPAGDETGQADGTPRSGTAACPSSRFVRECNEAVQESNYHIPQAWAEFLAQSSLAGQWSWYGHFTHKDFPHPEAFDKLWKRWLAPINREAYGLRYYKTNRGVTWARASERQARGSLHYHALIGDIPEYVDKAYHYRRWEEMSGFCRIERYQASKGAEFYMSKDAYAWKHGEIDLSANLRSVLDGRKVSAVEDERREAESFVGVRCRHRKELLSFVW